MSNRTTFEIMGSILELSVELNQITFIDTLETNQRYLILIEKMLKKIRNGDACGYLVREHIEKIWGYDLDEGLDAHKRCSEPDPED